MKMKKIAILFATSAAVLAMSSCKQNEAPQYTPAAEGTFELNTPALAQQLFQLTPDGVIDLTWSQPDWGFSAVGDYQVQVSLNETFRTDDAPAVDAPAAEGDEETDPAQFDFFYTLPTVYHTCSGAVSAEELATAMCVLRGIKTEEEYTQEPPRKVYLRIIASVKQIEGSTILSNPICLSKVEGYCAIQSPGKIYLVGQPEGWKGPDKSAADHYADWSLFEKADAIGSQIYYGTFMINQGQAMFRFYTALTGWDADSWGSQADDNPVEFEFTDGEFNNPLVKGKGSFSFPSWPGGNMQMEVNMEKESNCYVNFKAVQ